MLRGGEACVSYVFGIALHCGLDDFSQIGVAFKEFWRELLAQPEHIVRDENLSVALGRCADADGRYGYGLCDLVGYVLVCGFDDAGEGAGLGDGLGVLDDFLCIDGVCPLSVVAAGSSKGLGHQANVSHDGNMALREERDCRGNFLSALDFDGVSTRLGNDSGSMAERKGRRLVTRGKGHIDDHTSTLACSHDRFGMVNHRIEANPTCRLHAVKSHGKGIAHQQNVTIRVKQLSNRRARCG